MKTKIKLACIAFAALSFSHTASATLTGEIHIGALFGTTAAIDFGANTVTFTPGAPTPNTEISFVSGDFVGLTPVNVVTYADFSYDPLSVTNPLWSIDADTYFELDIVTSFDEDIPNSALDVFGLGTLYHDGDSAKGVWSFSADRSGSTFNFSSTNATVPDGGATVAIFGLSLLGLGGVRRFLTKRA